MQLIFTIPQLQKQQIILENERQFFMSKWMALCVILNIPNHFSVTKERLASTYTSSQKISNFTFIKIQFWCFRKKKKWKLQNKCLHKKIINLKFCGFFGKDEWTLILESKKVFMKNWIFCCFYVDIKFT